MVILRNDTIEQWISDRDKFCLDFMEASFESHHAIGVDLDLHRNEIESAHDNWVAMITEWQTKRFRQETESLSYTKIMAILLWSLSQRSFIGDMREYASFRKPVPVFNGSDERREELRADLLGAPEAVTALQFCLGVLNFYEGKRIDRKTGFVFRVTESGRHDMLVLLTSEDQNALSVYMILEGFYSRD